MLCMLLACLPMIMVLVIKAPLRMLPFIGVCGALMWAADMGADFRKQIRWMWRLSKNGPLVWTYSWGKRWLVRVAKATLGAKLDRQPLKPQAIGAATRRTSSTLIKWLPLSSSDFSSERYELQIAPIKEYVGLEVLRPEEPEEPDVADWHQLQEALDEAQYNACGLSPDTLYAVRVRACNSRGRSEWCEGEFHTKQVPFEGGGRGPGYWWTQTGGNVGNLQLRLPLPASTKAKQLRVSVKPTSIEVVLHGEQNSEGQANSIVLVTGELHAPVKADEFDWELSATKEGHKELQLNLLKAVKDREGPLGVQMAHIPFWPSLLKGHPEVEVATLAKKADAEQMDENIQTLMRGVRSGQMGGDMDNLKKMMENAR